MPDPSPFPDAYLRFAAPVRAKVRRLLGDGAAADDVTQETFLRLWTSGPRVDGGQDTRTVMAWLYRTSTRLALDALRRRRHREVASLDADTFPCACRVEDALAARTAIVALCRTVPDDELEAVVICRVDGLSQPEAAEVLGVTERPVRRRLDRFDARLRDAREEVSS